MYVLDTNIFRFVQIGDERVMARLVQATEDVAITVVTKAELLRGRVEALLKAADGAEFTRAERRLLETEDMLGRLRVLGVNEEAAMRFDRLRANRAFRKLGHADVLIASIVLAHDAVLVTRNTKDFKPIPGLRLENWVD